MGIIVVNNKGLIELINPFALNLFGYKNEELIEKPIEFLIPRRYHHQHVKDRQAYTHNPRNRPMGLGMDLYGMKKDGTEFPVEISLGHYENNGVENVIAFLSDISIRKKAETQIKKLNDELESLVEQRTRELTAAMRLLESSKDDLSEALQKEK